MVNEAFSSLNREGILKKMQQEEYDLLIIGGGITGAGVALDAASRGMRTALVEMQDFAAGTSSRSSKLVHGGLRYLKKLEVKLVAKVGKERAIVYENGPHVTTPQWMILPIYQNGTFGKYSTSIGLRLYDFLASVKKSERRKMFSKEETLKLEPLLKREGLKGGGYYVEYRTDDSRLTIEVMKEAVTQGAAVMNYIKVKDLLYNDGKVSGAYAVDQLTDQVHLIRAKKIVNAAGPWVDTLRERDHSKKDKFLHLTKGIHLVFDQKVFPLKQSVYFDTPDNRMVLAIPRDGKTYVGTTDTTYEGDLIHPRMTNGDRSYVINAINFMFPELKIKEDDIESSWVGLRPLIQEVGKGPSEISRHDEIWESESGLLTIAGGKLTGYRKMAETIVDLVAEKLTKENGQVFTKCKTKSLPISGGHVGGSQNFDHFVERKTNKLIEMGLSKEKAHFLVRRYGSNIDRIYDIMQEYRQEAEQSKLPIDLYTQVLYSIKDEMAVKPVDFFVRRTGTLLFDIEWVNRWKTPVIDLMSKLLNWSQKEKVLYSNEVEQLLHNAVVPVDKETRTNNNNNELIENVN